jgi:hypothetical protein
MTRPKIGSSKEDVLAFFNQSRKTLKIRDRPEKYYENEKFYIVLKRGGFPCLQTYSINLIIHEGRVIDIQSGYNSACL